ncbi:MAG: PaaI family thioesterase [Quisquiliibacterium sp.]
MSDTEQSDIAHPVDDAPSDRQTLKQQAMLPTPSGFRAVRLGANPFLEVNGPLFGRLDGDQLVIGLRIEQRHCNPAGFCHGGMLLTFADMTLILGSNVQSGLHRYMTTVNLSTDFIRGVPQGGWLEGRTEVLRITRNHVFSKPILTVNQ